MLFSAYCTGEFVDINNVQECIIFIVFLDDFNYKFITIQSKLQLKPSLTLVD